MIKPIISRFISRPSAMTVDELLKRMLFIYMPILTLLCFLSFTFTLPSVPDSASTVDDSVVKFIIAEGEDRNVVTTEAMKRISRENVNSNDNRGALHLDFLVAGFAKSGSTSLLHLFNKHEETSVPSMEICAFNSDMAITKLSTILDNLQPISTTRRVQRGIKCPTSIWDAKGLAKLATIQRNLKIIVGVRHPVSWFQSYYNYRVTEMHDKNVVVLPPPAESLIGPKQWMGVSTDVARFELGLMQLGKIEIDYKDLLGLGSSGRRIFPSSFKVFLYSIEQLEDTNKERSKLFRQDLQKFLGLESDIKDIPRSNVNHFTGKSRHPETIDICSTKYKRLRSILVKNGIRSNRWIRSKFMNHIDVTVGGSSHFSRIIDGWGSDPCP